MHEKGRTDTIRTSDMSIDLDSVFLWEFPPPLPSYLSFLVSQASLCLAKLLWYWNHCGGRISRRSQPYGSIIFCLQYPSLDLLHGSGAGITPLEKLKMMGGEITTLKGGVFVHEKLVSTRTGRCTSDLPVAIRTKVLTLGSLRGLHLGFTTTFSPTFGNLL